LQSNGLPIVVVARQAISCAAGWLRFSYLLREELAVWLLLLEKMKR
jgi:hypothetical protein